MNVLENTHTITGSVKSAVIEKESGSPNYNHQPTGGIEVNYFNLLDETPDFSEAAILLEDDVIEYCYVKNGSDGKQYFWL